MPLFGNSHYFDKLSDLTNQIDELLIGVQHKFQDLQTEIDRLGSDNIQKITYEILDKQECSLLQPQEYPGFQNLNVRNSIEYLTNHIYDEYGTTSILHLFDFNDTYWSESLRLNLFRILRSLFNNFYQVYSSSYLSMELTQEFELVMVDMKFKDCKLLDPHKSKKFSFDAIDSLIQKMDGDFSLQKFAENRIDIVLVVPLYV